MKKFLTVGVSIFLLSACSISSYSIKRQGNLISFYLRNPTAKSVYFVSNLTNFKKVKSIKENKKVWKTTLRYSGGVIKYFYIVDGKTYLPPCNSYENDDFGGKDCVYISSK